MNQNKKNEQDNDHCNHSCSDYRCCCMRNRLGIVLPGQRRSAGTRSRLRTAE